MLYTPAAHEPLTGAQWSADDMRSAIASIAAEAEAAFDDGWAPHPEDEDGLEGKPHGLYLGGAGVVAALHRLQRRGYVGAARDYVPYLERACDAGPDFAEESEERSLWMGELGIRLVLERIAPAESNVQRMVELIAANAHDERCELMWGSPGSILAARELGLDVTASVDWLRA